jgi:hypothetical protein
MTWQIIVCGSLPVLICHLKDFRELLWLKASSSLIGLFSPLFTWLTNAYCLFTTCQAFCQVPEQTQTWLPPKELMSQWKWRVLNNHITKQITINQGKCLKRSTLSPVLWLVSVNLATLEIGRIAVLRPAWGQSSWDPILTNSWVWRCASVIPAMWEL